MQPSIGQHCSPLELEQPEQHCRIRAPITTLRHHQTSSWVKKLKRNNL